jgi:two-component system, chemotaxis family, response regulator Rcp1
MQVLIVEDNPADVNMIQEFMIDTSPSHQDVVVVDNGTDALRIFAPDNDVCPPHQIDLIILDLNLPGCSGQDVLEVLHTYHSTIPVIVYTTSSNQDDINKAYQFNANCYVVKPSDLEDIERVLGTLSRFWFQTAKMPSKES